MLSPPFTELKFRIWQRTGFDPQIKIRRWDVIGMMAAAVGLGWFANNEAASATSILFPVALLGVALIAAGFFDLMNWR